MSEYDNILFELQRVKKLREKYFFIRQDPDDKRIMIATDPPRKHITLRFDKSGKFIEVV